MLSVLFVVTVTVILAILVVFEVIMGATSALYRMAFPYVHAPSV